MRYVIWCDVCTPDPTPEQAHFFASRELRGAWASGHVAGCGHTGFTMYDLPTTDTERQEQQQRLAAGGN